MNSEQQAINAQAAESIVINEIHYNPADNTQKIEFIELYNPTTSSINLSDWILTDAVEYTFPSGAMIGAGQYQLVAQDPTAIQSVFGRSALGPWDGNLNGDGEKIELRDAAFALVDEVNYDIDFPWPVAAGGDGASMELLHPLLNNGLGSSWRSSPNNSPTPGLQNGAYLSTASAAPPNIRQVTHSPQQPAVDVPVVVSAKVTDLDGVASVQLQYQTVTPGNYVPAYLAKSTSDLLANPLAPRTVNPAYNANWTSVTMRDDGTGGDTVANDDVYATTLPARANRRLVRYRIVVADTQGASVRVPYADDPSLNFAYFVYNGVPAYVASSQSAAGNVPYTHSATTMNSLPVYTLLTSQSDLDQAVAYDSADQIPREEYDARSAFNWSGTFVYNGKVYDNIRYRLRQRNARYGPWDAKRSFRFRFNRGSYAQFHDLEGDPYPTKWRTLNTHKMWGRGSTYGINEMMNNRIWETFGVPAPATHWTHFRVVSNQNDVPAGANSQFQGDFYGMLLVLEDYDSRFLAAHDLEKGNLYKLKSDVHDGKQVQRYQAADSVSDASDFDNILWNLRPERSDEWLNVHVDYAHWYRYNAVVEAIRHYDFLPSTAEHLKNRVWYFAPSADTPLGQMRTLPWDADASWGPTHATLGEDFAKQAIYGYGGAAPRSAFLKEYRNTIRELRDLIWQEDQINIQLDYLEGKLVPFAHADRDRWKEIPGGNQDVDPGDASVLIQSMKNFAFVGGSWIGGDNDVIAGTPTSDSGISGQQGRDAYLDWLASDSQIPNRPSITYVGGSGYPIDQLSFQSSAFADPQGANTFGEMEWRLAEITDPAAPVYNPAAAPLWEYDAVWQSDQLSVFNPNVTIPSALAVPGHAYRARVRMKDNSGRWSHWSAPVQFIAGAPTNVGDLNNLTISEIHYNPLGSDETEFLEFRNDDTLPLYLNGVTISSAVVFTFATDALLQPGEHMLVIEDTGAFKDRYVEPSSPWHVPALNIAGKWSGKLSNGGEEIVVSDSTAQELMRFTYSDSHGWLTQADDLGSSLELIPGNAVPTNQPAKNSFLANPNNWQPSRDQHGTPGSSTVLNPFGDVNCDGLVNVIDALFIMQYEVAARADSASCPLGNSATNLNLYPGDINADNSIDIVDALLIMQCEASIPNEFCP